MTALETRRGGSVAVPAAAPAARRPPARRARGLALRIGIPVVMLALLVAAWQLAIRVFAVEHYILPEPLAVLRALVTDWPILSAALLVTLKTTFMALGVAIVGGVLLAVAITQWRWLELAVFPYAVILQVTPIIAVAPLVVIWIEDTQTALLVLAVVVAFFPILANTTQGLKSVDHDLLNLFDLFRASRWQTLVRLRIPSALPYFLTGLRTAGGLSLIAAVVAEFAAGSSGRSSGLAFRILESQFRMKTDRLFAGLLLLALAGVAIYAATSLLSYLLLRRWHDSTARREA